MPIWSTILTVLPDEVLRLTSSGSVGLLSSDLAVEAVMMEGGDQEPVIHKPFKPFFCAATHQMEQTEKYFLAPEMNLKVYNI